MLKLAISRKVANGGSPAEATATSGRRTSLGALHGRANSKVHAAVKEETYRGLQLAGAGLEFVNGTYLSVGVDGKSQRPIYRKKADVGGGWARHEGKHVEIWWYTPSHEASGLGGWGITGKRVGELIPDLLYYQCLCSAEPKRTGWRIKHGTSPAPLLTKLAKTR